MSATDRIQALRAALEERILVLDGAMGTAIQNCNLTADDFGGPHLEGCNEHLVLTRPDVIEQIHRGYLDAGADIIETDTFGGTRIVLAEYGLQDKVYEINHAGAQLARRAADAASTAQRPRFVAGSMGPGTKTISVTGGVTFDEVRAAYTDQTIGLIEGGVDVLYLETQQDTLNVKAALLGIDDACARLGRSVPVVLSVSIETMGTMLAGQSIEALYVSMAHRDLFAIGMNCATGPDFMTDHLRTLAEISRFPISVFPNAGLPDEEGHYNELPAMLAKKVERFCAEGWVNIIGGCCGTTAEHIRLLAEVAARHKPRRPVTVRRSVVSGIETLTIDQDTRPVIVGERTNVLGSRKFKELVATGELDQAAEVGRAQVRKGAHVLDVCLQDPDRNELADVIGFLEMLVKKVKVPIMIDSTDAVVIEQALKRTQGKSIINSINLEDGEERFQRVVPMACSFGAALVVGCIDEDKQQAQAITRARKLQIAQRSHNLLTQKYGVPAEDIFFDALVFPVGTGDKNYIGSGVETIEGIRLIKAALPECKTILGISNVSFGLPTAGREVLNSVFLYHCVQAGLDMAIVNSEKLERYPSIPEEERRLAEDLIWWRGDDPIAAFSAHFRTKAPKKTVEQRRDLPLDERLALYILEGSKDGLFGDLDEALRARKPLDIVNGPLMKGMDEVGRLFGANEMIVAEVLQSAEAMKAAVAHLEPHMEKADSSTKGRIVLATVKGDVHDIGKNLVDIILSNNGFKIINLGIKVPPEELIKAYRQHEPDAIGLSGLLVKSAQMMVVTAQDLKAAGVACPILVGGAALSNRFTRLKIAPEYEGVVAYAKDAMTGLDLANQLMDVAKRQTMAAKLEVETKQLQAAGPKRHQEGEEASPAVRRSSVRPVDEVPSPPDLRLHVLREHDLDAIFRYINPAMLYTRHLGFKGKFEEALAAGNPKAKELREHVAAVEAVMLAREDITAKAVYRFFPAHSDGDTLLIFAGDGRTVLERFHFGRQSAEPYLCLTDFTLPIDAGRPDYVCLFATTVGPGVRKLAEQWKEQGEYLKSHILQILALEGAEAFAELLHQKIREMWGFADAPGTTMMDVFKARYRGVRVSFGYPACPRLEDQEQLFRLLDVPKHIGVHLTEGYMMEPEGSVTALVLHHPEAKYFNLSEEDVQRLERAIDRTEQRATVGSQQSAADLLRQVQ
ncbi:MAG TPA: methionine synthase [Candidatus Acidoferrales bacterium]|nr:methionine synthase [Candidatus Acidoferrales bacterium]